LIRKESVIGIIFTVFRNGFDLNLWIKSSMDRIEVKVLKIS